MPDAKSPVVGLDLGSREVRCMAAALERNSLRFLGAAAAPVAGWEKGRVRDPQAVSAAIYEVVHQVEVEAGIAVDGVVLGIGGPTVHSLNSRGVKDLGLRREVLQSDVNRAVERACGLRFLDDEMILQVFPQYFTVDEDNEYRDPRGIPGSLLEANVHVIVSSKSEHEMLVGLCNQAHLRVDESVFEPVATALAAVLPEDRQAGVALVDVGEHNTQLLVYWKDMVVHSASMPICAQHFTRDVARLLTVSVPDAERLKVEYGCALVGLTADNSRIEIPSSNGGRRREAQRRYLNGVLEARGRELFDWVYAELSKVGMAGNLGTGVVLSGGGALLAGFCDLAEQRLNCPARLALPIGIRDLPDRFYEASWTTVAGLAMFGARLRVQESQKRESESLFVRMFSS